MYVNPKKSQLSDANRRIVDASGPQRRVYQAWKGSNRFFLGGRFIFGPDVRSLVMTVFLIVTPVILFGAFVSPNLVDDFQNVGNLVLAIAVMLMTVVIVLLFITSGRDPGIIPRNTHPPEPEEFADAASLPSEWSMGQSSLPNLPPTKDVVVNGFVVKVKYCHTCMLYRPPRCSHCSICNNCVERFDHHCPWVGQCIGMRNYRFFFMFVSSTMSLCVYVFAFCWVSIKHTMVTHDYHLGKALLKSPITCLLIVYTFIAVWFVGGLTTFHLYLISTNQTTYENFRYRYDGKMNPHNRGVFFNFWEVFFSKVPPSKNNFRAMVKDEPPAFPGSLPMGPVLSQEMAKPSLDLEMGVKRQTVEAEEFADIHSQIETVVSLDGYGPYSSRHKMNSEIAPDRTGLTTLHDIEGDLREHDSI